MVSRAKNKGIYRRVRASAVTLCASICIAAVISSSCDSVNSNRRIPAFPVNINLADPGLWNTYGVSGLGIYRWFIKDNGIPYNFHYTQTTYTGYGGVMIIGGIDPFSGDTNVPLAYDLSCPVECKQDIRVYIDANTFEAVCPVCLSHYDVMLGGGAPTSGPAATGNPKYGLQRYNCYPQTMGGYIITR